MINLRERYGDRYRIGHDPAAETWKEQQDPWMMTVLCQGGVVIYPVGGDDLAVEVDHHPGLARQLQDIPGVTSSQSGDHEQTFLFDLGLFDRVAAVVKPRKKRKCPLSREQQREAGLRLVEARGKAKTQSDNSGLETLPTPQADPSP
jgi:hypothetical protein